MLNIDVELFDWKRSDIIGTSYFSLHCVLVCNIDSMCTPFHLKPYIGYVKSYFQRFITTKPVSWPILIFAWCCVNTNVFSQKLIHRSFKVIFYVSKRKIYLNSMKVDDLINNKYFFYEVNFISVKNAVNSEWCI